MKRFALSGLPIGVYHTVVGSHLQQTTVSLVDWTKFNGCQKCVDTPTTCMYDSMYINFVLHGQVQSIDFDNKAHERENKNLFDCLFMISMACNI